MPEKCKDCCSRLFCMSVAEVNGEDFATMANKKDCRKRVFTNADRIRAMSDDELCSVVRLAAYADVCYMSCECHECVFHGLCKEDEEEMFSDEQEEITTVMKWLKQPAEE